MIFLNSASSAAAHVFYLPGVWTHTDTKGKQRKSRVRNILKSLEKNTMSNEHSVPKWSGRNQVRSDLAPHLNFLLAKPKSQELGMAVCAALTKWISATHIWKSICVSKVCLKHRSGSETLDAEHLLCVTLQRHCIWRIWGREGGGFLLLFLRYQLHSFSNNPQFSGIYKFKNQKATFFKSEVARGQIRS